MILIFPPNAKFVLQFTWTATNARGDLPDLDRASVCSLEWVQALKTRVLDLC